MKSSLPPPNKEDVRRFHLMQQIGCVACLQLGYRGVQGDVHHLLSGNRRISHKNTVCLCPYHHRGIPIKTSQKHSQAILGPSLATSKKDFITRFGNDEYLLNLQNEELKKIEESFC